jgi:hypothetical protein
MNVHSATCSGFVELHVYSSSIRWRIFCQTGIFRGVFSTFNFVGRISKAAMKGVGDIIFHNLGAQWKGTPSYCIFLLVFFYIIRRKDQRSCDGRGGGLGDII